MGGGQELGDIGGFCLSPALAGDTLIIIYMVIIYLIIIYLTITYMIIASLIIIYMIIVALIILFVSLPSVRQHLGQDQGLFRSSHM